MRRLLWCLLIVLVLCARAWCIGLPLLAPLPDVTDRVLVLVRVDSVPAPGAQGWQFEGHCCLLWSGTCFFGQRRIISKQ